MPKPLPAGYPLPIIRRYPTQEYTTLHNTLDNQTICRPKGLPK